MRWVLMWAALSLSVSSLAAPRVAKDDLQMIPAAWLSAHKQLESAVQDAAHAVTKAEQERASAKVNYRSVKAESAAAPQAVKARKKAYKKARKSGDRVASGAESAALEIAKQSVVDSNRLEGVAQAELGLAEASYDKAQADHDLAVAQLEQARAQAVSDAGGWVDVPRFDAEVELAKTAQGQALTRLQQANTAVVLAGQR
jgi:hypothetical protein